MICKATIELTDIKRSFPVIFPKKCEICERWFIGKRMWKEYHIRTKEIYRYVCCECAETAEVARQALISIDDKIRIRII